MNSIKTYLIYTSSGFTQDQHGNDTENLQILGWEEGSDASSAITKFQENNTELSNGYSDIQAQEIVNS